MMDKPFLIRLFQAMAIGACLGAVFAALSAFLGVRHVAFGQMSVVEIIAISSVGAAVLAGAVGRLRGPDH